MAGPSLAIRIPRLSLVFSVFSLASLHTALAASIVALDREVEKLDHREVIMEVRGGVVPIEHSDELPFEITTRTIVANSDFTSAIETESAAGNATVVNCIGADGGNCTAEETYWANKKKICKDVIPLKTGFDVHTEKGFQSHASCEDLMTFCHNGSIGEPVRVSCPLTCKVCKRDDGQNETHPSGPCFDAVNTGIRFRDGPSATCKDLINYCTHPTIGAQVNEACKLSCGGCDLFQEGPFVDQFGSCVDLQTDDGQQFTIAGQLTACSDMAAFCENHPDSLLIKHKCPLTCGVCGDNVPTAPPHLNASDVQIPDDAGGCDRRRRFGFCSSRRRRNV